MTRGCRKDIENVLRNISLSSGLSEKQLQESTDYIFKAMQSPLVEQTLLERIKVIGDGEFTVLGTPQEFIDKCNRK